MTKWPAPRERLDNIDQFVTNLQHPWLQTTVRMNHLQKWKVWKVPKRAGNGASEVIVVQIQANQGLHGRNAEEKN
jgi:hypothetical protein